MTACTHKKYSGCPDLVEDPANVAEREGLVNVHTDAARERVGVWRWQGVHMHKDQILPLIKQKDVIDFGGYAGPLGYGSTVVDFEDPTHRALYDVEGQWDVVFTSHTLEHIQNLPAWLACVHTLIRDGGHLIVFVPSSWHVNLRAENWEHHCQTFCLSNEPREAEWVCLDELLQIGFDLQWLARTPELGLFAIARKRSFQ